MKIVRHIAQGGFGVVEEVKDKSGERFARKTFGPRADVLAAGDPDKLRVRFIREVKVQLELPSSAFVPVVSYDLECDAPWFLMPLAKQNFREAIDEARVTGITPKNALFDILNSLEELHAHGYVHRDLKPENVLLLEDTWKLSDLGLVMLPTDAKDRRITSTASTWGTLDYWSPEQAGGIRNVTAATDVYAFGCILHDIFDGARRIPLQKHSCKGPVGMVIERCTDPEPRRRFKDVAGLRAALAEALRNDDMVATAVSVLVGEWIDRLRDSLAAFNARARSMDGDDGTLAAFAQYLTQVDIHLDHLSILTALDETLLRDIFTLDQDAWRNIALTLCQWISSLAFSFDFCDVLAGRTETMFALGTPDVKAAAALSLAELGSSHNRWYVMRRLLALCGASLEERIATRIAIDIKADGAERNFQRCAEMISEPITLFHPTIRRALSKVPMR